ncbi:hypothetical protein CI610_03003 [invertebrate metagenome]|uniref:Uncharacterized protein n=1 Tax=invertebrate metagenome TaxID=1711999 RepID=A0A2H9T4C0_9ZZZZ
MEKTSSLEAFFCLLVFDPLASRLSTADVVQTGLNNTTEANFFRVTTLSVTAFEGSVTHHHLIAGGHSVDAMPDHRPKRNSLWAGMPTIPRIS